MLPEPPEPEEFLAPYSEEVRELLDGARRRLLEVLPPVCEIVYDAISCLTLGFSFTERPADNFIHVPAFTKHVNLGFTHGAFLDDPQGRLQGTGNQVRHVRLTSLDLLGDPYVLDLVAQAARRAVRPATPVEPVSVIRVMNGPKRRPS